MAPAKPNSFSTFMFHYIAQERRKGRQITPIMAQSECGPLWQQMSLEERHEYKIKAKNSTYDREKLTSDGRQIAQVEKEMQEQVNQELKRVKEIEQLVENTMIEDLAEKSFYFIDCSIFCKTNKNQYVPAEITVMEFNMRNGEQSSLHQIIKPDELPVGYYSEALMNIETIHRIPLPPYKGEEAKTLTVVDNHTAYRRLMEWCTERDNFLFCAWDRQVEQVRGVVNSLAVANGEVCRIKVARASVLLYNLNNYATEATSSAGLKFPFVDAALEELNRDPHSHIELIACEFHSKDDEKIDKCFNCTLSAVRRLMFSICAFCCPQLKIQRKEGVHCPSYDIENFHQQDERRDENNGNANDDGFTVVRSRGRGCRSRV